MTTLRVVHYLNQFFAGIGAEDKADMPPAQRPGPIGPGRRIGHSQRNLECLCVCSDDGLLP